MSPLPVNSYFDQCTNKNGIVGARLETRVSMNVIPYNEVIDRLKESCYEQKLGNVYNGLELCQEFRTDVDIARNRGTEFLVDPMPPIDFLAVKLPMNLLEKIRAIPS